MTAADESGAVRPVEAPADERSWLQRLLGRLPTVVWLTVMWVILWGDPSPGTILAGLLVASLGYSAARLPHLPVRLGFHPIAVLRLASRIGYDLFASSVRVAFHVLWRPERTRGAIVAVPMRTDSDFLLALVSGGLSLVTGSLVIELNRDQGVIYVHGIPVASPEAVEGLRRQVRRTEELIVRAFGNAEDIAEFERAEREYATTTRKETS
ncbi:Na+/H+ antiporter subunit E [Marinactinospora thermotolerans]|uniref:Multisubunit sodium/proton antiporter, MrpE subunit (TC 2.A.63.1) n=1 Tax=Marinactinospora thermotolerans DSM 45154 TaxID=1122192 RepID=A0A1T4SN76_9ACTN|nr:Na+/H+ antiporter subunit E [Marinactinospora thermotolerans]SKA29368.1 multisubunit sodium/proton antiporter, MrpE subunit (TC 2.A.63.1) [Marinactinospora thermotolerans DSM 45154]